MVHVLPNAANENVNSHIVMTIQAAHPFVGQHGLDRCSAVADVKHSPQPAKSDLSPFRPRLRPAPALSDVVDEGPQPPLACAGPGGAARSAGPRRRPAGVPWHPRRQPLSRGQRRSGAQGVEGG